MPVLMTFLSSNAVMRVYITSTNQQGTFYDPARGTYALTYPSSNVHINECTLPQAQKMKLYIELTCVFVMLEISNMG